MVINHGKHGNFRGSLDCPLSFRSSAKLLVFYVVSYYQDLRRLTQLITLPNRSMATETRIR
jgi:hypothetical protein